MLSGRRFFTYIVELPNGDFYTGWTTDRQRRLRQHNGIIPGGAKRTRGHRPIYIIWFAETDSQSHAMRFEGKIKKFSKPEKIALISDLSYDGQDYCSVLNETINKELE